jgi:hypothetical protein
MVTTSPAKLQIPETANVTSKPELADASRVKVVLYTAGDGGGIKLIV